MQKTEHQLRAEVINELQLGSPPKSVAELMGIPLSKVLRLQGQYRNAVMNNTVEEFMDIEGQLLDRAAALLSGEVPTIHDEIESVKGDIRAKLTILEQLDDELSTTARQANTKLRAFISTASTPGELSTLIDSLGVLRSAFFNKNLTQVNIQNNTAGGYNWSSDIPGAANENN